MCKKCSGYGKQYKEVFPGAWQLMPCSCIEISREDWLAELIDLKERLRQKREKSKNERQNGSGSHRELLLTT